MRSKWPFRVVALATAFTFFGSTAVMAEPGYYPSGPQTNVAVSQVSGGGWEQCYSAAYNTTLPTLESLRNQCQGNYILYAAGSSADASNFLLLAAGERGIVFAGTNFPLRTVISLGGDNLSNGTYFYAQDDASVGFSENSTIQLWTADICASNLNGVGGNPNCATGDDGSKRLSWHANPNGGGWRIGTTTDLNANASYFREIWVSNASPRISMPLVQTKNTGALLEKEIFACSAGSYKVGMSEVSVNSLRYHLYVNDELMSTVVYDKGANIQDSLKRNLPNKVSALVSEKDALFDMSGMSSYSAHCVVEAYGYGSSTSSPSSVLHDSAYYAAIEAKKAAEEAARQAALVEFNSKENRELRKRLAARGIRG